MSLKSSEKVLIGKMREINFCYQKKGKEAEEETRITRAENILIISFLI